LILVSTGWTSLCAATTGSGFGPIKPTSTIGLAGSSSSKTYWLNSTRSSPVRLAVAGESTGPYWWHAFYQFSHDDDLRPFDPELALFNPARVKGYRKALPEQDKADPDDARLIDRYYRAVGNQQPHQFYDRYLRLRTFTRAYRRVTRTLASEKAYLLSVIYLSSSEYQRKDERPFLQPVWRYQSIHSR